MPWYVKYDSGTGRLETESDTEIAPEDGKTVLQLADRPRQETGGVMWDEVTRTFIARPPKIRIDRLDDLQSNPNFADFMIVYNTLNNAQKTRLRNVFIRLLGSQRFRNQDEPVELE